MGARVGIKKPLVPDGSRGARAGTGLVSSLRASQVRECGSASRLHPHPQAGLSSNYHGCCLTIRDSCPDNLSTQVKISTKIIQNGLLLRLAAHRCCLSVGERGGAPADLGCMTGIEQLDAGLAGCPVMPPAEAVADEDADLVLRPAGGQSRHFGEVS